MAQKIQLKRSSVAGRVPTTSQLDYGEIGVNTADGKIYVKKSGGGVSVVEIGGGSDFSGAYADLTGKPSLFSGSYADLTGKPSLFSGAYADLTGKPSLFSGSYNDLSNIPFTFNNITGVSTNADLGVVFHMAGTALQTDAGSSLTFNPSSNELKVGGAVTASGKIRTTAGALQFTSANHQLTSHNTNNVLMKSGTTSSMGLLGQNSSAQFRWQLYGDGSHYGFLDGNWGSWDVKKQINGPFQVDEGSGLKRVLNEANWSSYITVPSVGNGTLTVTAGNSLTGGGSFTANQSGSSSVTLGIDTPDDAGSGGWYDVVAWNNGLIKDASVELHGAGYLKALYLNMSHGVGNNTSDHVFYSSNDDYIRKNSASGFRTSLDVYNKSEVNALIPSVPSVGNGTLSITTSGSVSGGGSFTANQSGNTTLNLTGNGIMQGSNAVGNGSFSDSIGQGFRFQRVTGGSNRFYTSHHNVLQIPNTSGDQYLAQMAFGTGDTRLGWRSKSTTFGSWYEIWHSGNDGSNSGMDSDLLDSQHGSYYLDYNNFSNTPSIPSVGNGTLTINTAGSASGSGSFSANQSGNNTITITGATIPTSLPANGGNADTLNNIYSSQFLRSDTADTIGATLTMGTQKALVASNYGRGVYGIYSPSRYQHVWSMGTSYNLADDGTSTSSGGGNLYGLAWAYNPDYGGTGNNAQARSGFGHQLLLMSNGTTTSAFGTGIWTTGTISSNTQGTLWGSSNDGMGSGLDAGLLIGADGSKFLKSPSNVSGWQNGTMNFSVRTGGSAAGLHMEESDGTFAFQLYGDGPYYGFLDGEWGGWDIQKQVNGAFKVDEGSGLKRVLNEANWSSYITIPSSLPANGGNADTTDGLHVHNTSGTQNSANQILRTQVNGYTMLGWINTTSGSTSSTLNRVYCSEDGYIRYQTPANFGNSIGPHINYNDLYNKPSIPSVGNGTLTINTSGSASGGGTFTANQSGNTTINLSATDTTANQTITLTGPVTGSGTTSISTSNPYQTSVTFQGSNGNSPDSAMEYQQTASLSDTKLAPSGDWYNSIRLGHGDPYNYYSNMLAMKMTGTGSGTLYTQVIAGGTAGGWNKYWHNNNDGTNSGLDAGLLMGMQAHTGTNNHANKIVRTDTNGYAHFGWINTSSGDASTTTFTKIYASSDDYIRYYTPANFGSQISQHINYNSIANKPSIPSVGNGTITIAAGTNMSGGGSFTANQAGNTTITLNSTASGGGGGSQTIQQVLDTGDTVSTNQKLNFRDSGKYIISETSSTFGLFSDAQIRLTCLGAYSSTNSLIKLEARRIRTNWNGSRNHDHGVSSSQIANADSRVAMNVTDGETVGLGVDSNGYICADTYEMSITATRQQISNGFGGSGSVIIPAISGKIVVVQDVMWINKSTATYSNASKFVQLEVRQQNPVAGYGNHTVAILTPTQWRNLQCNGTQIWARDVPVGGGRSYEVNQATSLHLETGATALPTTFTSMTVLVRYKVFDPSKYN